MARQKGKRKASPSPSPPSSGNESDDDTPMIHKRSRLSSPARVRQAALAKVKAKSGSSSKGLLVLQLWSTTPISQLPGLKQIVVSIQGAHLQMHALPNPEKERWSVLLSNLYVNFLLKLVCIRRTVLLWLA